MPGFSVNGMKYIQLINDNNLKKLSLCDNVYFILRDIFMNCDNCMDAVYANTFNSELTGEIYYEDRTPTFAYTNVLQDKSFVKKLVDWLNTIGDERWFDFSTNIEDCIYEFSDQHYIHIDDWLAQFNALKHDLKALL